MTDSKDTPPRPSPVENGDRPSPVENGDRPSPVENGDRPSPVENAQLILAASALLGLTAVAVLILHPFREVFPEVELGIVAIEAQNPTLSQEAMVSKFTDRAEKILRAMPEIDTVISRTTAGWCWMTVMLKEKGPAGETASSERIAKRIAGALKPLNASARVTPMRSSEGDSIYVYFYSLSKERLEATAKKLTGALSQVPSVEEVRVALTPLPVALRLDGQAAVRVKVMKRPGVDALSMLETVQAQAAISAADAPGLRVWIDERALHTLANKVRLAAFSAAVGLSVFALVLFGFRRDIALLGIVPLAVIGPALSLLMLRFMGISLNGMTLTWLVGVFGTLLSTAAVVFGFYRRRSSSGIKQLLLPLAFSLSAAVLSFAPFFFIGGMVGKLFEGSAVSAVVVLTVSTVVFAAAAPYLMQLSSSKPPLSIAPYRTFLLLLFRRRSLRIVAWALPQVALVMMVLSASRVEFRFMPTPEGKRLSVWVDCDAASAKAALLQLEARLKGHEADIERIIIEEGAASSPYHALPRFGPNHAQIEIALKNRESFDRISPLFPRREVLEGCDVGGEEATFGRNSMPPSITISGRDPRVIEEIGKVIDGKLSNLSATHESFKTRLDMDREASARKNGLPFATLFVEEGYMQNLSRKLLEIASEVSAGYPGYSIEDGSVTGQNADTIRRTLSRVFFSFGVVGFLLLVIHILAGSMYRSAVAGFVLLSPLYIAAPIFIFSKEVDALSLSCLLFLPPILGTIVFAFFKVVREEKKRATKEEILDVAEQLFHATAPLFCGLLSTFAILGFGDTAWRSFAVAAIFGLLMIFYWIWVPVPLSLRKTVLSKSSDSLSTTSTIA